MRREGEGDTGTFAGAGKVYRVGVDTGGLRIRALLDVKDLRCTKVHHASLLALTKGTRGGGGFRG